jgi:Trypsin-like peptidase domain
MTKRVGVLLLPLIALSSIPAVGEDDLTPLLKAQTVMISVSREGGGTEVGSGVILCQDESQAYILTARHVVYGKSQGHAHEADASEISRIAISFFTNLAPQVVENKQERVITKQRAGKERDLLLLSIPLQSVLPAMAVLSTAPAGTGREAQSPTAAEGEATVVYTIGSEQGQGKVATSWAFAPGKLIRQDSEFLYHSAPITPGFSGGPLFDESGALIGINVSITNGIEIGADPGVQYGQALPIGPIIETINKWLPGNCLRNVAPVREIAYETYRRAMRAVSIKNWPEAERLMGQALQYLPQEGGSVHLQGMRYTTYLPRYHLGLAYYKQNHCGEALREWGRSETQKAIQEDKRYDKLRKFKKRCVATLRREIQKAAATSAEVR